MTGSLDAGIDVGYLYGVITITSFAPARRLTVGAGAFASSWWVVRIGGAGRRAPPAETHAALRPDRMHTWTVTSCRSSPTAWSLLMMALSALATPLASTSPLVEAWRDRTWRSAFVRVSATGPTACWRWPSTRRLI